MRGSRVIALSMVLLLSGCGSFEKRGTAARMGGRDAFSGRWDGRWTSAKHRTPSGKPAGGRLRCFLTPIGQDLYDAEFRANWWCFVSGYRMRLEAQRRGQTLVISGSHDLGPLFGGEYRCSGKATASEFEATYDSRYDSGEFKMLRPADFARETRGR